MPARPTPATPFAYECRCGFWSTDIRYGPAFHAHSCKQAKRELNVVWSKVCDWLDGEFTFSDET